MAKFKVGDKVTDGESVYLITGMDENTYDWKCIEGRYNPSYRDGGEFSWAERTMKLANASRNAVAPELRRATKLRLKENFSDEYGSYRKGDVFQVYTYQFSPHHAILVAPGREVTLEVPWDKVEVANACRNSVVANALNTCGVARNDEKEQREVVRENIESLKRDIDKVVRGLNETKRWMSKYSDERVNEIEKAKSLVVQALSYVR